MRQQLSRRRGMMWVTAPGRAAHLMYKRQYLLCLLAACYRYLEEDELLRLTLESARNANTIRDETLRIPGTETMYSPDIVEFDINLVDYWRRDKASYRMQYAVDVGESQDVV